MPFHFHALGRNFPRRINKAKDPWLGLLVLTVDYSFNPRIQARIDADRKRNEMTIRLFRPDINITEIYNRKSNYISILDKVDSHSITERIIRAYDIPACFSVGFVVSSEIPCARFNCDAKKTER